MLVRRRMLYLQVNIPPGFVLDVSSGYFQNADTGMYFDASSGSYYNGVEWLRYDADTGQYVPLPS